MFDGLFVARLAAELDRRLSGGQIQKIQQPDDDTLVFFVRTPGATYALVASRQPEAPRLYLAHKPPRRSAEGPPSPRLQRIRKHLQNGRIAAVTALDLDRIAAVEVEATDELGDRRRFRLLVELTGRNANVILIDADGRILETLHPVTADMSRYRQILPGLPYVPPPPQDKIDPRGVPEEEWIARLRAEPEALRDETALAEWLTRRVRGFGPLLARETAHRAARSGGLTPAGAARALVRTVDIVLAGGERPELLPGGDRPAFHALALTHRSGPREAFDDVLALLQVHYERIIPGLTVRREARALRQALEARLGRLEKKIARHRATLAEADAAERHRRFGELILAYQYAVPMTGVSEAAVPDPDDPDRTLRIPLDPALSPAENAERHFRRYQKLKAARAAAEKELERAEAERRYLEEALLYLDDADAEALADLKAELAAAGLIAPPAPAKGPAKKTNAGRESRPERFLSSEGALILVGKSGGQNDRLTFQIARPDDLWLHAKNLPGAHVVVRGPAGEATLEEAALIAAYFSKGRHSSRVPVDYTPVKNVHKPKGAPPGFVLYRGEKTLFVTPSLERVLPILARRPDERPPAETAPDGA
ncbi:MAG: NFACT family protein [Hydrogenibacillus schlegelii]|uniref:Rqc2 homolog RqcH n=1 Tax=Hydrogenibacillus schlegelii TaxID=1484 RepID=A0A947CZ07_HYDSH|nr:NFACT family protein [Hydrogenibacillus schlegelii]